MSQTITQTSYGIFSISRCLQSMFLSSHTSRNNAYEVTTTFFSRLDVHKSVHRDTTMKITNKIHYID